MEVFEELNRLQEPVGDVGAAKTRVEAALAKHLPARSAAHARRRFRLSRRVALVAIAVLALGGAAALAETSPWSDVPGDTNWASLTLPVSHDASSMVLGTVPQLIHCTSSMTTCSSAAATSSEDRTAELFFRAGEGPHAASDFQRQLSAINAADVPAPAFRIWTTTEVSHDSALNPISCVPSDSGWTCSQLSPGQTIPGGTPIYLPQPVNPDQCFDQTPITGSAGNQICAGPIWAWGVPNSQNLE